MSKRRAPRGNESDRAARIKLDHDSDTPMIMDSQALLRAQAGPSSGGGDPGPSTAAVRATRIIPIHSGSTSTPTTATKPTKNTIEIENLHPDGDLVLNFRYCVCSTLMASLESGSGTEGKGIVLLSSKGTVLSKPSLRLRVSSAVISVASSPLKLLVSDSVSTTRAHDHPLVMICPPRVWGFRESPFEATIIFGSDRNRSNSVEHALKILFLILNFKTTSIHRAPPVHTITRLAELGWVFDCIGPLLPWMHMWIGENRQEGHWARMVQDPHGALNPTDNGQLIKQVYTSPFAGQCMVMSWVIGDEKAFAGSSRDYIFSDFRPKDVRRGIEANQHSDRDLGIVTRLYEDLCSSRQEFIRGIFTVLNETFTEACANAAPQVGTAASSSSGQRANVLPTHVHALILGSLVQSVVSIWGTNFPLESTWNLAIQSLWERVEQVARVLENACAQLQHSENVINDPVTKFKRRMDEVFGGLKGLKLKDYRPEATQLMDFETGSLL